MVAVAAQASIAFDNATLYAEARRARITAETTQQRFRFLAEASDVLAESLDYERTLQRVAELAVPDWPIGARSPSSTSAGSSGAWPSCTAIRRSTGWPSTSASIRPASTAPAA